TVQFSENNILIRVNNLLCIKLLVSIIIVFSTIGEKITITLNY
ncbi:hypothetical protein SAMN02745944_05709, partial [Clostridium magnum DSM 2767]